MDHPASSPARVAAPASVSPGFTAELEAACAGLETYGPGADRARLLPIEEAVRQSGNNPAALAPLARRLAALLARPLPLPAVDFICDLLGKIGGNDEVPALASALNQTDRCEAARAALERIPGEPAARALRRALTQLTGNARIGVMLSIGRRHDRRSVPALGRLLTGPNRATAEAAAAALGEIGDERAARLLSKLPAAARQSWGTAYADAVLRCAERLAESGHAADAARLVAPLTAADQPRHVRAAATRWPGVTSK